MNHYLSKKYLHMARLQAYLEQYKYVNEKDKVLEIGKGAGVFGDIVSKICEYKSLDIDETTNPDFIGNILEWRTIQVHENFFNVVFCCQVLEHLPWDQAKEAFQNLLRLKAQRVVISIPDNRRALRFQVRVPRLHFQTVVSIPFTGIDRNIKNNKEHHWEIWHKNFDEILSFFSSQKEYKLVKHYRLFERTYQHFFVFEHNNG